MTETAAPAPRNKAFLTRHTSRGEDSPYRGISAAAVEKARERARSDLRTLVENSQPGAVVFIGGSSEAYRTGSTAEVYGDELKNVFQDRDDVIVIAKGDIRVDRKRPVTQVVESVAEIVKANPDKRVIVDFPLFLEEFSERRWITKDTWHGEVKDRKLLPYYTALLKKAKNNQDEAVREWFRTRGKMADPETGEMLEGPNPEVTAAEYLQGLGRLRDFARRYIGNERPLTLGVVAHSFTLDAFITKYASADKSVTPENFEKVAQGRMIEETEVVQIDLGQSEAKSPPNAVKVTYRGKEFQAS